MEEIEIVGIPSPDDPHPDCFSQAKLLSAAGKPYTILLLGACTTDRESVVSMVNNALKCNTNRDLPDLCVSIACSTELSEGVSLKFGNALRNVTIIMGNNSLEAETYLPDAVFTQWQLPIDSSAGDGCGSGLAEEKCDAHACTQVL